MHRGWMRRRWKGGGSGARPIVLMLAASSKLGPQLPQAFGEVPAGQLGQHTGPVHLPCVIGDNAVRVGLCKRWYRWGGGSSARPIVRRLAASSKLGPQLPQVASAVPAG